MNRSGLVGAEQTAAANEPLMSHSPYSVHHQQPLNPSKSLPTLLARNLVVALNKLQEISEEDEQQQQQVTTPLTTALNKPFENTATDKLNNQQQLQLSSSATSSVGDWWSDYWSRQPFPSGYTQSSITLIACLLTTIIFLIVVGNLLVCIAIFTEKSLKPTQNWFIASLAVSDMLLGLVVMPFSLARELMGFWIFGPLWCDIHEAIDVLLTTASINTLCLISLDRYWSITQAVSYLKKRTPRRGAFMIAFVWVFSAAVSLPPLFGWKKQSPSIVASNSTNASPSTTAPAPSSIPAELHRTGNQRLREQSPEQEEEWPPVGGATAAEQTMARRGGGERRAIVSQQDSRLNFRRASRQSDELATPMLSIYQQPSKVSPLLLKRNPSDDIGASSFQLVDSQETAYSNSVASGETQRSMAQQQSQLASPSNLPVSDQTTEYPSCQLSDDVGYVLYSALGSFYIPCAVMVFTYIKIFLAARSRARRTINKQSRSAGQASAGRRTHQNLLTEGSSRHMADPSGVSNNITSCGSVLISPSVANSQAPNTDAVMKGKIVIVERRKSLVQSAAGKAAPAMEAGPKETNSSITGASCGAQMAETIQTNPNLLNDEEQSNCTLITSGAKQASPNALNSSASNDSSMITVMNASMTDVPVTEFNFRGAEVVVEKSLVPGRANESSQPSGEQSTTRVNSNEESRKAASLLRAISQAGQDELLKKALSIESGSEQPVVPDIVVERRTTRDKSTEPDEGATTDSGVQQSQPNQGSGTNETCFMTIEEDSDMFDAQTGRTIMMIAGNASQKQANNLAKSQAGGGVMMTMMTVMPSSGHVNNNIVCNNMLCRHSQHPNQQGARSGSSYCGSSMTINDDDLDECNEDELLTDDCNGFSVSCALDQYCPGGSSCAHCHECERELNSSSANANGANRTFSVEGDSPPACAKHHAGASSALAGNRPRTNQDEVAELEAQSIMGDGDNVSHLTEYRSQEDSSSIVGHDMLDATETHYHGEKKKSIAGQSGEPRKMSIIGFRLARLGAGGGGGEPEQPSGLIALASSQVQHQHQQQQLQQPPGGTRNLKALRQNFFFKLNQLTAKSGTKNDNKTKKAPTNDKSSAQSSGTSHDNASVDCATTSNVQSTEYHQSTTGGETDDFEQQTSMDTNDLQSRPGQQRAAPDKRQTEQAQSTSGLMKDNSQNNKQQACFQQVGDKQTPYKNDDRALLLRSSQPNDRNGARRSPSTNSMLVAQANNGKRNLDLERRAGKQASTISGQLNHSPTILSSNTATGGLTSGANRAYLASDNERHKRKLAKARERRATLILGLIMTTFICSWLPFFTFYVLRALCNSCREYIPPRFEAFIFWMGYCNSAINPIIYTIFNRDFRKAFRKILFKCL